MAIAGRRLRAVGKTDLATLNFVGSSRHSVDRRIPHTARRHASPIGSLCHADAGGAGRANASDLRAGGMVASPVGGRTDHCSED